MNQVAILALMKYVSHTTAETWAKSLSAETQKLLAIMSSGQMNELIQTYIELYEFKCA